MEKFSKKYHETLSHSSKSSFISNTTHLFKHTLTYIYLESICGVCAYAHDLFNYCSFQSKVV